MGLLEIGQIIRDTCKVERFLGEGAFAEVHRVKPRFLGRQAMKVFKRVGTNLDEIQEMPGEAILLTHPKHPKARQSGRPAGAAVLMEKAFNNSPELRSKYAPQARPWRCGSSL